MSTFVLVHGGFHGGWCYSRVAFRLREAGHVVHTPTLSGLADRAPLAKRAINLTTHIGDVITTFVSNDLIDVVLCGHSLGGMVITGVAGHIPERIKALVYVDAAVPENGQSVLDVRGPEAAQLVLEAASNTGFMVTPPSARSFHVNSDDVAWVESQLTPHPIGCFVERLHFTGREGEVRNRTYVLATGYPSPVTRAAYEKARVLPDWRVAAVDCGHDVMIDDPVALTNLLLEEVAR